MNKPLVAGIVIGCVAVVGGLITVGVIPWRFGTSSSFPEPASPAPDSSSDYVEIVPPLPDPEPTPEPTTAPEPTPEPEPTPTPPPIPEPLDKQDFLITVISTRQVTLTNNSQRTAQVYKSSITYECYSYVYYNMPGKPSPYYGPIIRPVSTSDESTELKPGQSFSKTIRSSTEVLAIVSCIFYIRDNSTGQTLEVTSP